MILVGNQRGGAKSLALHLLKEENEHIEVHELRGFVSDNLMGALNEAYAVSRGTKAKQFLFSLSLNPPKSENVPTEVFEDAIKRVEDKLGLTGQPRAIVFHEKKGRRHCHAVWSRTKIEEMKAIQLSHSHRKMGDVARELFLEHGWKMPRGLMNSKERDPLNFTLAQWQQAKRLGKDPREIKSAFQECWAVSDTQATFAHALKSRGYVLARGDRGFVALDHRGEVFAVSKWVGLRVKAVWAKLKDEKSLPSVEEARGQIAQDMAAHLGELKDRHDSAIKTRISEIEQKRQQMARKHAAKRKALKEMQERRWVKETRFRQDRYNKGLRGLLDRLTGKHRRIKQQNKQETQQAKERDTKEKDALIFRQLDQRRSLQARIERLENYQSSRTKELDCDISRYGEMRHKHFQRDKQTIKRFPPRRQSPARER